MDDQPVSSPVEVIALIDWNTGGHHETYLRLYASSLLRIGRRVIVLCRAPEELRAGLASEGFAGSLSAGLCVAAGIPGIEFFAGAGRTPRLVAIWRWSRAVREALLAAEASAGLRAGRVHFLGLHEHQTRQTCGVVDALGRPWSGLYLHAYAVHSPERRAPGVQKAWPIWRLFARPGLRGLLMLDESASARVAERVGRPVALAPDLTDETAAPNHPLGVRTRRFAAGAPLAGLLGHLVPSKGAATLARVALREDARDIAFAFAGEPHWGMFSAEEAALLRRAMAEAPTALFHLARLPDEAAYNAVFASCDVICAAYRDFPHSSNTLTKAAVFERPLVVGEGHVMASRVREYRMGEIVPVGDEAALLAAVRRIVSDPAGWRAATHPRWSEYRALHSAARLDDVLARFFREGPGT